MKKRILIIQKDEILQKIIFLVLFLSFTVKGQSKKITVDYSARIEKEEGLFGNNVLYKNLLDKAMADCYKITFQLIITENGAKFFNKENLESDINRGVNGFALGMLHYGGIVYSLKDKVLEQHSQLGENVYTSQDLKTDWALTNETKLIDNYLCYKATNIYKVEYGAKVFNHPVTAWYCPALPYSYGPIGYGNLPGLILELQVRNAVFGVKNINLQSEQDFDIKVLNKIKILSRKEMEEAFDKLNGL